MSFIFLAFIVFSLINTYVSIKYEVDEPKSMGKINDVLIEREKYLKQIIFWHWVFVCFVIGNILVVISGIISNKTNKFTRVVSVA